MTPIRYTSLILLLCLFAGAHTAQAQCSANAVATHVTCSGLNNGSIDLTVTNGTAPYTYTWSNGNATQDLSNLAAGTYTCTVTDELGCTATASAIVAQPPLLTVTLNDLILTCFNPNGTMEAMPTGGTPPYTYLWSNGTTTANLQASQPGTYTVTVTDSHICSASASANLLANTNIPVACIAPPPTLTCAVTSATLNGSCSSVGPNFTYLWTTTNGNFTSGTNILSPVVDAPGVYTLLVVNTVNGCTSTASVTVAQDVTPPIANAGQGLVLTCSVVQWQLDGSLSSTGPNFSYFWVSNNGGLIVSGGITLNPTIINPGVYILSVTNAANGCTATDQVIVVEDIISPSISPGIPDAGLPCGGGTVQLQGSQPNGGGFDFLWTGPGITPANQDQINPTVLAPGTYTFIVTNTANGCSSSDDATVFAGPLLSAQDLPKTNISCFGLANGLASATPSQGQGPYDYAWTGPNSYSATGQTITNLSAGTYTVAATDALGCTYYGVVQIIQPSLLSVAAQVTPVTCAGAADGIIVLVTTGGTPPYFWPNGQQTIANLAAGVYTFTVTDASACSVPVVATVTEPPMLILNSTIVNVLCGGGNTGSVDQTVAGGSPPYTYAWSNGLTSQDAFGLTAGQYTVTVIDVSGCSSTATFEVQDAGGLCGVLEGQVYDDLIENCAPDGEPGLGGWIMRAESSAGTFFGVTDANGHYSMGVLPGDYTVFVIPPSPLWIPCSINAIAGLVGVNDTVRDLDFPIQKFMLCPQLTVSLTSSNFRRCFTNNYYSVQYCNTGSDIALGAYIILTLDASLTPLSSSIPYTNLGNGMLRFEVGDLDLGECGAFKLYVKVACDAALGQTHCTEAHIYPDTSCIPPDVLWSGASLRISSECQSDSVRFTIENIGTGNMPNALDYIVIEDLVMLMNSPVQLNAGEAVTVSVPANGSTWRLEVEQEPLHPGQSRPSVSVEGCTTGAIFSTGFVAQFPANDADEFVDVDCKANTGSYDPNDKQGFPKGYGAAHYIRPGTPLEYQIQFQNTGNDTAFTVRILDTLSVWLDPATIRPGASSHPYTWDLTGTGLLSFLFENILLPDSNVNEPASHGFVQFTINHKADAPLETVIENTAEIYFDFNDAIVTNTTFHRLGENFVSVGLWQPERPEYEVLVSPNPFSEETFLEVKGLSRYAGLRLQVFDLQGKTVLEMESEGAVFHLKKGNLPAGLYLFKIQQEGKSVGAGKLAVKG